MAHTETVTVVFTDLVGSTELASRLGHDAYEALRQGHFAALRTAVAQHGGSEVKTTGDGLRQRGRCDHVHRRHAAGRRRSLLLLGNEIVLLNGDARARD